MKYIQNKLKKHTSIQSILLHLIPGIAIAIVYYLLAPAVVNCGFPNEIANQLSDILALVPVEIGILLFFVKKETGTYNIMKLIPWIQKASMKEYLVFILTMAVWALLVSYVLGPFENILRDTVFSFIPDDSILGNYNMAMVSQKKMILTGMLGMFANGLLAPVVEELYFRGYLLPRIDLPLIGAVVFNSVLFSLYHFYSPWFFFSRILMMIPLYYWVAKKKNIRFSMISHMIANSATALSMITSVI